jgi:hypothetical protein
VGGSATGGAQPLGCSPDLRWVYDASGVGVTACSPDAGCAEGQCVEPCEAARQAGSAFGCDFTFPAPETVPSIPAQCFAIAVENTWDRPVTLDLALGNQTFDVPSIARIPNDEDTFYWPELPDGELPPGAVAVLFLASSTNDPPPASCPIPPAIAAYGDLHLDGTGRSTAWRLQADAPVAVWTMMPSPNTFQASTYMNTAQLYPTGAWGTDHVALLAPEKTGSTPLPAGPHYVMAVASEDDTVVTLEPTVTVSAANEVAAAPAGVGTAYLLQAGELIEWSVPSGDLSGSRIDANKPVGVWAGNRRACLTTPFTTSETCLDTFEQLPSVAQLGHDYLGLPHPSRLPGETPMPELVRYRLVGARDGTQLSFAPNVPGAPSSLAAGQVADIVTDLAFEVQSQSEGYPFYAAQMMSGCVTATANECYGSEELVMLADRSQLRRRWSFFVAPELWQSDLVLVRWAGSDGTFADVDITCGVPITGWQPFGVAGDVEWTTIELASLTSTTDCAGAQALFSAGLFGATLWSTYNIGSTAFSSFGLNGRPPSWIVF